ncbi:MAG: hypothetical protein WAK82_26485 [Streptosporangiaceae bacterium]
MLVTPDTILRWHRDIVRRWAARSIHGRTGRPATRRTIKALVLRLVVSAYLDQRDTAALNSSPGYQSGIATSMLRPVRLGHARR